MTAVELVRVNEKGRIEPLPLVEWARLFNEANRLPAKK